MSKTVFEKVISGEFEASFVYQDDACVAFMDLHPLNPGHVLVVPREPISRLAELAPTTAAHLFTVAQKILIALEKSSLNLEGANIFLSDGEIAGQEVPHVHLHIVPRFTGDGIQISFGKPYKRETRNELNRMAELISSVLE